MLPIDLRKPAGDPLRGLCLGAHSDDVEIGAGGLVRRLVREAPEVEVDWYVFTAAGPRADEARESAAWFTEGAAAARVETLDYRESFFPEHWAEIKERLFEIRQATSPDVVLSHRLEDRHQDHRVLAELTWNTFRDHVVREYEIPKYEGDLGQPNVFAPLTRADAEAKADAVVNIVGIVTAPFLIALMFFSPRAALCLAVGTLLATFCAVVIQLWYRSQANRSLFRRRQVSSKTATVSEAVVSILWAAGAALAFRHGIFMVPLAVMACIVMGVAFMLRPQTQS